MTTNEAVSQYVCEFCGLTYTVPKGQPPERCVCGPSRRNQKLHRRARTAWRELFRDDAGTLRVNVLTKSECAATPVQRKTADTP